ncbi:MAG TPA: peptide ABC transporter substrate-binding protein [Gammaproteobacteria bacterium]
MPESDWRLFRKTRTVALERFCDRTLREVAATASADSGTAYDRYLAVYDLVRARDKQSGLAFDDPRRSRAISQLAIMLEYGLVTDAELRRFSAETQAAVRRIVE